MSESNTDDIPPEIAAGYMRLFASGVIGVIEKEVDEDDQR